MYIKMLIIKMEKKINKKIRKNALHNDLPSLLIRSMRYHKIILCTMRSQIRRNIEKLH